jgi:hypothetical protein
MRNVAWLLRIPWWAWLLLYLFLPGSGKLLVLWLLLPVMLWRALRRPGPDRRGRLAGVAAYAALLILPIVALGAIRFEPSGHSESAVTVLRQASTAPTPVSCRTYYEDASVVVGPLRIGSAHMNLSICWDGTRAWRNWGPDCAMSAGPLWTGTAWCGVLTNQGDLQPAAIFGLTAFAVPAWERSAYLRFHVRGDGSSTAAVAGPRPYRGHGTVLDVSGYGNQTTPPFVAENPWDMTWSWDCSTNPRATFQVDLVVERRLSNDLMSSSASGGPPGPLIGSHSHRLNSPGAYHFVVKSGCAWHILVQS